jgi:Protein of unknown function (DUF4238)
VSPSPFRRKNHYVPCVYLKGFGAPDRRVFSYRTLVAHDSIPLWKPASTGCDGQLSSADWTRLVRFLAAQIVRTPAHLVKNLPRWQADAPSILDSVLKDVEALVRSKAQPEPVSAEIGEISKYIPIRVAIRKKPDEGMVELQATVAVGRGMWLFEMKHLLTHTIKLLHEHRWSIIAPLFEGQTWFTSDDPVVMLNYHDATKYDSDGGWGQHGTEILFPLSPRHIMYTRVGDAPPRRGEVMSREKSASLRRIIAEHAYRMIFAALPDSEVSFLRPRVVDERKFREEQQAWATWHSAQAAVEQCNLN